MPKGVEHGHNPSVHGVAGNADVPFALMPKGVEHTDTWQYGYGNGSSVRLDAERR